MLHSRRSSRVHIQTETSASEDVSEGPSEDRSGTEGTLGQVQSEAEKLRSSAQDGYFADFNRASARNRFLKFTGSWKSCTSVGTHFQGVYPNAEIRRHGHVGAFS